MQYWGVGGGRWEGVSLFREVISDFCAGLQRIGVDGFGSLGFGALETLKPYTLNP